MIFRFIYEPTDYPRIIPAVLIDERASIPAIANNIGDAIKIYCDAEIAKILSDILFFKIETAWDSKTGGEDGVLVGYFSLKTWHLGNNATLLQFELRPQFQQFSTRISAEISTFITSGDFKQYYL